MSETRSLPLCCSQWVAILPPSTLFSSVRKCPHSSATVLASDDLSNIGAPRCTGNHTGYRHWTGTKATAQEISDLYQGLKDNYLDDFDMMLSGYIPGAEGVLAVGNIAKELREKNASQPGKFFWVLDPVMGDNGHIYVAEDVVPAYKSILPYADLVIPNQFEAEYVLLN